ncbi:hypothetical protein FFWV33_13865 [Flavobacterium faecale]|uniref:DUF2306 domain-containing protein n=1 Tax=Flavobacterium faecale TaxID=1355330 RepID=A0A2S1LG69_9FLAO|nr:hypothetical protein [Flavobacterium faecale]AWG22536.1 hypothetical protein FFWV33_13865 [Flavobacterium faecale]
MEATIKIMIYIHAFFGGIGLISGIGNFILKKGNALHKYLGRIFSYSMVISSLISLVVAMLPNHNNLFLFLIGVLTIYMVLTGNRALTFKNKSKLKADYIDISISGIMLVTSVIMAALGIIGLMQNVDNSILYILFGSIGLSLTIKDFKNFRSFKENKKAWLKSHIGRMVGALIASVTAFMVAGLHIGTLFVWIAPTVIGTAYIIYWTRKLKTTSN